MRGMDRWGVSEMLKRIMHGFEALPESTDPAKSCWFYLGIEPTTDTAAIKKAYLNKTKDTHPDVTKGEDTEFKQLQDAYVEAKHWARTERNQA